MDLYHPVILKYNQAPFHFYKMDGADLIVKAYNPVCGDEFSIFIKWDEGRISNASFHGYGCAVSKASSSLLIKNLIGKSKMEALKEIDTFLNMLDQETDPNSGELSVFRVVKNYPSRMSCVILSWKSLNQSLQKAGQD